MSTITIPMDVAKEMCPNAKPGDSIQMRCTIDASDKSGLTCTVDEMEPMESEEPEPETSTPPERPASVAAVLGKKAKKVAKTEPVEEE